MRWRMRQICPKTNKINVTNVANAILHQKYTKKNEVNCMQNHEVQPKRFT